MLRGALVGLAAAVMPRNEITITNRESGTEGEINRISERPVLDKPGQQAKGKLDCQNYRQHRPRHLSGAAKRHPKAPP